MDYREGTEGHNEHPFDALAHLEYITNDDYFNQMNEKVNAAEERLNTCETTPQEKERILHDLNADWIYMRQKVAAWGTLLTPVSTHESGMAHYVSVIMEGEKLTSAGYELLPFAATLDEEVVLQYKIAYAFTVGGVKASILRERFTGDFPDSTPDMARRRLEYHYPGETARVVELARRTDNLPTATPVMNFRDYEIDFYMHSLGHSEYISDMQTYLYELMRFDKQLPYYVKCTVDESDDPSDVSTIEVVARPEKIQLLPADNDASASPRRHLPYVELTVYDADSTQPNSNLLVPLRDLLAFESIRRIGDRNNDEEY